MRSEPGIYVEITMRTALDRLWQLTQDPALHGRWDLRFSRIEYLPPPDAEKPQQFLYETRIGFGLSIQGTGESVGQRASGTGDTTSSLRFASDDWKSLIREGSGYWRYVPAPDGIRFFTWYDYRVRFGAAGRMLDLLFRPLIGWATAWSFDCLRLWAEGEQSPESSIALASVHAIARAAIAAVWVWHGLVPKLLLHNTDEQVMLLRAGIAAARLPRLLDTLGMVEILFGLVFLFAWSTRWLFLLNAALMVLALVGVALQSPAYLWAAFNPVTLNLAVIALSAAGRLALPRVPMARRCRRSPAKEGA